MKPSQSERFEKGRRRGLCTKKNDDDDDDGDSGRKSGGFLVDSHKEPPIVEDPLLLSVDVLAILLSCQLMGFVDVLNDPSFWKQGGFFQPIPAVPSTLGLFVQRASSMAVCWVSAGLVWLGFSREAYKSDEALVSSTIKIYLTFVLLRFGLAAIPAALGSPDPAWSFDFVELGKQCYYPLLITVGFRYFYSINNR